MKKIACTIVLSFFLTNAFSQIDRCATDKMVQAQLSLYPEKQLALDQLELFTTTFIDNLKNGRIVDSTYIIPVVVHVIHNYGEERINQNQIESAIKSMCDDFNMLNDDFINENGQFVHSVSNNNDTVNIILPDIFQNNMINWLVENGSSVQKK